MTILEMEKLAVKARRLILKILYQAGSGHTAGSLSVVEILISLYFHVLKQNSKNPTWSNRDRLIVSCGHIAPALYSIMSLAGYYSSSKLKTLRQLNSIFQGHPHNRTLPGIEASSGPLGQGLSVACGMALAARLDHAGHRIYCLMSDGEQDEGNIWEAAMFASKEKLHNLIAIIDRNKIQIDGYTEDIMPLESLKEKYHSFNWRVIETDGNEIGQLIKSFDEAKNNYSYPTVIIAHTLAGCGVDFMERDYAWHGKTPNTAELKLALKQLEAS